MYIKKIQKALNKLNPDTIVLVAIFLYILIIIKIQNFYISRTLQEYFEGLLPRDNPRNTRFAINFFTTIGLGGLT